MSPAQFEIHANAELSHWWFLARRRILQELLKTLVSQGRAGTVVDIGSGTGANAAAFADLAPTVGIDVSHFASEIAQERFPHVEFHCGQIGEFPQVFRAAQVVTLLDVLEHVPDDILLLSEVVSMTQPGTYIVITVPAEMELWSPHDEALGHYRRYSEARLAAAWEGLPVDCHMLTRLNSRLYWPIRLARVWNRWRGRSTGAGNDLASLPSLPNSILKQVFQGESKRIVRCLKSGGNKAFRRGVSLLAVLKRHEGDVVPRCRPSTIPPDPFDPLKANSEERSRP